ncbi:MAG TPA: polyhydroxyalkanoate depolymerase, partial [Rhizomicrobium sp.]
MAVCQPCPSMLATVALMAEDNHPATPKSLTLMAGPVDTSISPTRVNTLAHEHPIEWFEHNLIATVPRRYAGAHRRVYPGFLQLSAFMTMNIARHMRAHMDLFGHILKGEIDKADANRKFYDEYFSVADLPAEFYLDTVRKVFQEHHLPRGIYSWRNRRVDPRAIRKTSLLTVEGERDDICGLGQTMAAQDLLSSVKPFRKKHYVQAGAGHYGVFSGRRWQTQIYPMVRNIIMASE